MAGLTDSLRILITANGAQAEREFSKVGSAARRNLGQAETASQRYGRTLTSAGVAMASFGAVALVGLGKAAQAAEEEHAALLRLQNSIQNMPELAGASTEAFLEQAAALQDSTKFADDATVSAQAMLGTFHLTEQQILRLTPLVQDYAAKFGVDLVTAAKQVGRAVSGSAGALQRNGIVLDESAYAADHFGTVLGALRENAGGFAAQEGQTLTGQIAILKNNLMDLAEGVGVGATEAFSDMAGAVKFLSDRFDDLDPATQSAIGQVATWGAVGLTAVGATSFLVGQVMKLGPAFSAVAGLGPRVYTAIANLVVPTNALATAFTAEATAATTAGTATNAFAAGPVGLTVLAIAGLSAGVAYLVEGLGELTGAFHMPVTYRTVDQWNGEVAEAIAANPELVAALSTGKQGFDGIGTSAANATQALDELSQEIQDYLDDTYDVPEALRGVQQAFDDLFATQLSGTASTSDLDAAYQGIVESIAGVVSAGGDADAVARSNILRLRDQRDAGLMTNAMYQQQRERILNIPGVSRTLFENNAPEAQQRTIEYRGRIYTVPSNWATTFQANTGSAIANVQALIDRIHALNSTTTGNIASRLGQINAGLSAAGESSTMSYSGTAMSGGATRMSAAGTGGGADLVVAPVILDGEKVGEVMARTNRRFNTGRGDDG